MQFIIYSMKANLIDGEIYAKNNYTLYTPSVADAFYWYGNLN